MLRLRRTITNQIEESSCQLFTGHIGCGKSTELFRLKDELERQWMILEYYINKLTRGIRCGVGV